MYKCGSFAVHTASISEKGGATIATSPSSLTNKMNHHVDNQSMLVQGPPSEVSKVYFDFVKTFWMGGSNGDLDTTEAVGESNYKRSLRKMFPVKEFSESANNATGEISYSMFAGDKYRTTITFAPLPRDEGTKISWRSEFSPQVPFTGPLLKWLMQDKVFIPIIQHFSNIAETQRQSKL